MIYPEINIVSYEIISIDYSKKNLVEEFLRNAGSSAGKFRYFATRPIEVLKNHIVTFVVMYEKKVVGYAHLENENGKTWLGTAVIEDEIGKGIGKMLMDKLFAEAKSKGIKKITLTVDKDNTAAFSLYKKYEFTILKETDQIYYLDAEIK